MISDAARKAAEARARWEENAKNEAAAERRNR